jgi:hypothetical protein
MPVQAIIRRERKENGLRRGEGHYATSALKAALGFSAQSVKRDSLRTRGLLSVAAERLAPALATGTKLAEGERVVLTEKLADTKKKVRPPDLFPAESFRKRR